MGYTKPVLRNRLKNKIMSEDVAGTLAGRWSARKAQLLAKRYEDAGGGYTGEKSKSQKSLSKWTDQKWRTKSGKPSSETGERYLPEKAIKSLSSSEYRRTTEAKRDGKRKGKQFVKQPKDIAKKVRKYRK
jgi:hypothetical protein